MTSGHNSSFESKVDSCKYRCGDFEICWNASQIQLTVTHKHQADRVLWKSTASQSFIEISSSDTDVTESRGFFKFNQKSIITGRSYRLDSIQELEQSVILQGICKAQINARWTLEFTAVDGEQLQFRVRVKSDDKLPLNQVSLVYDSDPKEKIFGFGEQFTHLNIKGRKMRVLSQEPGIGRGVQPLTWVMNTMAGAGGEWDSSNAPAAHYISSNNRSLFLENSEYSVFDFTAPQSIKVTAHSSELCGRIIQGNTPFDLIEVYTRYAGRMPAPPKWLQSGAIIGMQGGTQAVKKMHAQLEKHDTPIAAFWLQDWVGSRKTSIGKQLWWNWEVGRETYPDWENVVQNFEQKDIKVLSYINPFLVDPQEKGEFERNLFKEAIEKKLIITKADGTPYWILNTSFSAVLLDLTNTETRTWIKDVIKNQLIGSGVSGWMADFGEALPFDAVLSDGSDAASYHNQYPVEWAKLNREAIQEMGKEGEIAFFARSGFTQSPRYSTLFWLGDQLACWRQEDGIKSTIIALLSSGLSGFSQNHSDIGGYIATTLPSLPLKIPGIGFTRGRELLWRWIELNAFTPIFRTHEGNQPSRHFQINGDQETLQHFARFSRVYAALADYRIQLSQEAEQTGAPLVRHPWLHFPSDENALNLELQFMLGADFMIAPCVDAKRSETSIYLPIGEWQHLWSDQSVTVKKGADYLVKTPLGYPAVFYRSQSSSGTVLRDRLSDSKDLNWQFGNVFGN